MTFFTSVTLKMTAKKLIARCWPPWLWCIPSSKFIVLILSEKHPKMDLSELEFKDGHLKTDKLPSTSWRMLCAKFEVPEPNSFRVNTVKLVLRDPVLGDWSSMILLFSTVRYSSNGRPLLRDHFLVSQNRNKKATFVTSLTLKFELAI